VHEKHGHEQRRMVEPPVRSLVRRLGFAVFHTGEVLRHFNASDANVLRGQDLSDVLFDPDRSAQHHDAQYAMAAHTLAAIENLHSTADLLAKAVFYSLKLQVLGEPPFLTESDVNYGNVLAHIRQLPACRVVAPAMHALKSAPSFEYLDALVEEGRRGMVVSAGVWFDGTGRDSETYRLRLPVFSHGDKQFSARDVDPLLLTEGLRVQQTVHAAMAAVNQRLSADL
jgi:hypothetical protein